MYNQRLSALTNLQQAFCNYMEIVASPNLSCVRQVTLNVRNYFPG